MPSMLCFHMIKVIPFSNLCLHTRLLLSYNNPLLKQAGLRWITPTMAESMDLLTADSIIVDRRSWASHIAGRASHPWTWAVPPCPTLACRAPAAAGPAWDTPRACCSAFCSFQPAWWSYPSDGAAPVSPPGWNGWLSAASAGAYARRSSLWASCSCR